MTAAAPLLPFAFAAEELRRQEAARLADAVPPTIDALRLMPVPALRGCVALTLERLGYELLTSENAGGLRPDKG